MPKVWRLVFLARLEQHGQPCIAADEAGVDRTTPYKLRASDGRFAEQWEQALERWAEERLKEAMRAHDIPRRLLIG